MQALAIIAMSILAAVIYGVVHDQVTARICVEYFTVAHPHVIDSTDPTVLALVWGVLATWWVGLILGVPLALAARVGNRPKLTARQLLPPMAVLLVVMGVCASVAGLIGYVLARNGVIVLLEPLASEVPREKHVALLADGAAHLASYAVGFIGGVILCVLTYSWRRKIR